MERLRDCDFHGATDRAKVNLADGQIRTNNHLKNDRYCGFGLLSNPHTPNMSPYQTRLATYQCWPYHIIAHPSELADAGFFYLKKGDRTKCFHCNGGLQFWKRDDDPWYEHAKWYPDCEYVIQRKGREYVLAVSRKYPSLKRPRIVNSIPRCKPMYGVPGCSSSPRVVIADTTTTSSSSTPCDSMMKIEERVSNAMDDEVVQGAEMLGFEVEMIRELVKRKLMKGCEYSSVMALVEDLQEEEKLREVTTSSNASSCSSSASTSSSSVQPSFAPMTSSDEENNDFLLGNTSDVMEDITSPHFGVPAGLLLMGDLPSNDVLMNCDHTVVTECNAHLDEAGSDDNITASSHDDQVYQNLVDEQVCKVCLDKKMDCLFLPCGHLCCCLECAPALKSCPVCRSKLEKVLKIYRDK